MLSLPSAIPFLSPHPHYPSTGSVSPASNHCPSHQHPSTQPSHRHTGTPAPHPAEGIFLEISVSFAFFVPITFKWPMAYSTCHPILSPKFHHSPIPAFVNQYLQVHINSDTIVFCSIRRIRTTWRKKESHVINMLNIQKATLFYEKIIPV